MDLLKVILDKSCSFMNSILYRNIFQVFLPEGTEMVMPGDTLTIKMNCVGNGTIPIENGQRFTIRESGKTIGTGLVTSLDEIVQLVDEKKQSFRQKENSKKIKCVF